MTKKIISILAIASLSGFAYADSSVTLTSAGAANTIGVTGAGAGETVTVTASGSGFIRQGFVFKKSANVQLIYAENANAGAVAANSAKGKNKFNGNTGGGAVTVAGASSFSNGIANAPVIGDIVLPSS